MRLKRPFFERNWHTCARSHSVKLSLGGGAERPKAHAVKGRRTVLCNRRHVKFGCVTHMAAESISRMFIAKAAHQAIARDFRNDRGRGNRDAFRIALHDSLAGTSETIREIAAVDQDVTGTQREAGTGPAHRDERRLSY